MKGYTMSIIAKQAVIIGGSMAGLAAARALSPYFETVVIVERDEQPTSYDPRKAVPQGHHVHALLKSGELALETLFPQLTDELVRRGAKRIDFSKDLRWLHGGKWKLRYDSGFEIMIQSRPLLEQVVRERVQALENVRFYNACEVERINTTADKSKVTSVIITSMETRSRKLALDVDLLVDASGRGSKMPQWLESLGYLAPPETRLKIDLTYSSRLYQAPEDRQFDWKLLVVNPHSPKFLRAGYIFPVENNHWLVTLAGYSGDVTPTDNDSFAEYAKGLAQPDIYNIMQDLTPLSNVKVYSVPYTVRRHYENTRLPDGVIIIGDAFCAFDPVYGQGMSTAAKESLVLNQMLANENSASLPSLGKRFHKKAAQIVDAPWMLTSSEDFRYPRTVGTKSPLIPILHWYSQHVFALSATDRQVFEAFRQVMHLLEGAEALFKPSIAFKVIKHTFTSYFRKSPSEI